MRFLLLGDLHFYQLGVWPWQLLSKRLLGQLNLWVNRRRHFDLKLWPELQERLLSTEADVLLGSGDFTTTALLGEFTQARQALQPLLDRRGLETLLVPGNHDRYTFRSKRLNLFERHFGDWSADRWPMERRFGKRRVIALDPTRPNKWNASGCVGAEQRGRLATMLQACPADETILVLCHYPIGTPPDLKPEAPGHGLEDMQALGEVLVNSGRRILYLHGHIHWPWHWHYDTDARVTTINAGAPMLKSQRYPYGQGFVTLDWPEDAAGPTTMTRHVRNAAGHWQEEPVG